MGLLYLSRYATLLYYDLKSRNRIFAVGIPKHQLTRRILQISRIVVDGKQKQCSRPGQDNDVLVSDAALCVVRLG